MTQDSKPDLSLENLVRAMDAQPVSVDFELAIADFLALSDMEQKRILFKAVVQHGGYLNHIVKLLRK